MLLLPLPTPQSLLLTFSFIQTYDSSKSVNHSWMQRKGLEKRESRKIDNDHARAGLRSLYMVGGLTMLLPSWVKVGHRSPLHVSSAAMLEEG